MYSPTGVSVLSVKEDFYAQLQSMIDQVPGRDTMIILGDFNATTGTDRDGCETCVGPHGSGRRDESSSLLLDFAKSRGLRVAGSWFQRPNLQRWTWYSNDGVTKKEIDHVLVGGRSRTAGTSGVPSSELATLKLRLRCPRKVNSGHRRLDVSQLKDPIVAHGYATGLVESLGGLDASDGPEDLWNSLSSRIQKAASESIPELPRRTGNVVSQETVDLIEEGRRARLDGKVDLARELRREVVRAVRHDREVEVRGLCETVESHLGTCDSRPAYRAIRKLRGTAPTPQCFTVRAADGDILTEESAVRDRWSGYFEGLYRADPPDRELATEGVAVLGAEPPINCDPPTIEETRKAVGRLKDGKAPGVCGIHAELLKAGGEATLLWLHTLMCSVWSTGVIPTDWKRGLVVPIWKGKGDTRECNNYRGVTLLSVPGKVFARILLDRIRQQLLTHQRPEQSGFTPKRSTVDRILGLRVLTERMREFGRGLLAAYIDFRKAFDSVSRDGLWRILGLRGIPPKLVQLISSLYTGTESAVKCGGSVSGFFPVDSGVRQGCVLAPTLFRACMDWIMERVVDGSGCGASFGNVRVTDLDFADDAVIFAETVDILAEALESLSEEAEPLGLCVSWAKTKIQAFGDILDSAIKSVSVGQESVDVVESFTYLGSVVHRTTSCRAEVNRRLGLAHGVMSSLNKTVWRSRHLSSGMKV